MTVKMVVPTLGRRERTVAGKVGMAETRSTGRKRTFYRPNASDRNPSPPPGDDAPLESQSRELTRPAAYTLHAQFRWRPRHGSLTRPHCPTGATRSPSESLDAVARAIRGMQVRGAPLIGATAACGVAIALRHCADDAALAEALSVLAATSPDRGPVSTGRSIGSPACSAAADERALPQRRAKPNGSSMGTPTNRRIECARVALIRAIAASRPGPVRLMTHCNVPAGSRPVVTAPRWHLFYAAREAGIPVEVWVSETRPAQPGPADRLGLDASEVPHTLIADNAAGLLKGPRRGRFLGHRGPTGWRLMATPPTRSAPISRALARARQCGALLHRQSLLDDRFRLPRRQRSSDRGPRRRGTSGGDRSGRPAVADRASGAGQPRTANPAFDVTPARLITEHHHRTRDRQPRHLAELFPERQGQVPRPPRNLLATPHAR